ncbi:hypothetical protein GCK32_018151, partial [Trichostrongylus colubriformis]
MATCAYLVSEQGSYLVAGKSKLPSLKDSPTVPKLELNALTMATRLSYSIHVALRYKVDIKNVLIMSDSEISLSWIKATKVEKLQGVLIKNRVAEIRRIVAEIPITVRFGYVKTSDNPADCGTRGVTKSELDSHMWWHGPPFISNDPETWPEESRLFTLPTEDCEEQVCLLAKTAEEPSTLLDWSRYNRLVSAKRTKAYVLRFLHNISRRVREKLKGRLQNTVPELCYMTSEPFITAVEDRLALQVLVRHHQKTYYTPEQLKSLKQLNVRKDENGILRCQGRLGKAQIDFDAKHPMLVASKSALAKAIVHDAHLPYHCGTAQTIANVRQQFWIPKRAVVSVEELETLLVEIEGTLNSRPLTYQEEGWEETPIIRPIDFIQRDMMITYPFEAVNEGHEDAEYIPPEDALQLRTRKQAEEALKTSHKLTERFWTVWSQQYLSSLREMHKLTIDNKRGSSSMPKIDSVVLISDPVLPRNSWKLGRIVALPKSEAGKIREAQLKLPSGRLIRRPINLLVPLELGNTESKTPQPEESNVQAEDALENAQEELHSTNGLSEIRNSPEERTSTPRYELRPRKLIKYGEDTAHCATAHFSKSSPMKLFLTCVTVLMLATGVTSRAAAVGQMSCVSGGVSITTHNIERYEICAEHHCYLKEQPNGNETIRFPPEVLLHAYNVQLKLFDGQNLTVLETSCPPESFCDHIQCWFCTANVFNPECSPRAAITALTIILYISIALLYALCYVPMVFGKPCRIVGKAFWSLCKAIGYLLWKICGRRLVRRRQRYDVEALLRTPLLAILCTIAVASACQDIDVFSYHDSVCTFSEKGIKRCALETTELMKLNSFNQEACIRLTSRQLVQKEIRVQWKGLRLTCVKETITFTRNTLQRVVDYKRCARWGSCVDDKCASINESSLVRELAQAMEKAAAAGTTGKNAKTPTQSVKSTVKGANLAKSDVTSTEAKAKTTRSHSTKNPAGTMETAQSETSSSRKRPCSTSSSSSSTSEENLPIKRGRASGTMLKELLKQGSQILQLAASKVDQLAPAVTVSTSHETTERLDRLEQLMKFYQEQNVKMHKSNEAKLERLESKVNILATRFNQLEQEVKASVVNTNKQNNEEHWARLYEEFKQLREAVCPINKLAFDIRYIHERFEEMGMRNSGVDTTTAPVEPCPELERIRRQISETEKELNAAREATLKANRSIEKEREDNQGRASSSKTMDRLRDWRRSCQARESRLQREMRDLETRLEREIRRQDRQSRGHSQEQQKPPLDEDSRRVYVASKRRELCKWKTVLESEVSNVSRALENYSSTADDLDPQTPSLPEILQKVLRKKEQDSPERSWDTATMLSAAKNYIAMELKVVSRTNKKREHHLSEAQSFKEKMSSSRESKRTTDWRNCFYCGRQDHVPRDCDFVRTREARLDIIRKKKLCHNCGAKDHLVSQCPKGPCRLCKQHGHHTSVCRQLFSAPTKPSAAQDVKTVPQPQTQGKTTPKRSKTSISTKVNTTLTEQGQVQDVVPNTAVYVNHHRNGTNVHILVGQAQVLNPRNQALEVVHVMLDTGADRSFISTQLADHLELRDIKSVELSISTFGSQQPLKRTCGVTELQMWDAQGKAHKVTVTKIDTVTEPILRSNLSHEDKQFLCDHNMSLSINSNVTDLHPQVLLGCADLYSFLEKGLTAETSLPSGLKL